MFGETIGIDLGSAFTRIYLKGQGIVLAEPTVAAVEADSRNILSIGEGANEIIGRTPRNIYAVRPLKNAVISDYYTTEKIIRYFVKKACGNRLFKPSAIICVPGEISPVCEKAVIEAAMGAGVKSVELADVPVAAALGAGVDILKPRGSMICDIGSESSDIAVLSMGGIVINTCIKTAGASFDKVISDYIKTEKKVAIGEKEAENIKKVSASLVGAGEKSFVMGRCLLTGLPKSVEISSEEILECIGKKAEEIVMAILSIMENTPPQLLSDISDSGITLCGGGALLNGMSNMIEKATGVKCYLAQSSEECTIKGIGKMIDNISENFEKAL